MVLKRLRRVLRSASIFFLLVIKSIYPVLQKAADFREQLNDTASAVDLKPMVVEITENPVPLEIVPGQVRSLRARKCPVTWALIKKP